MVEKRLITKSQLAIIAGVSQPAVTQALKRKLSGALEGKRVNLYDPAVQEYLDGRPVAEEYMLTGDERLLIAKKKPTAPRGRPKKRQPAKPQGPERPREPQARGPEARLKKERIASGQTTPREELAEDVRRLEDMRFGDVVDQFGTATGLNDWLKAVATIQTITKTKISNAESEKRLVSVGVVEAGIIVPINKAFNQMLRDGAQTMSTHIVSMVKAGDGPREVEDYIRESLGVFIKMAKNRVRKTLRECKSN